MPAPWEEMWKEGRIGFHSSAVHRDLIENAERFLFGGTRRVLVPLCGKSVDMRWLADAGHHVVGVELVEQAVRDFFREQGWTPRVENLGPIQRFIAGNVEILQGDLFSTTPDLVGPIDRIWDRAALVAVDPEVRRRYVAHLAALAPGSLCLLNVFEYEQGKMTGPPFSVADAEIRTLFADTKLELAGEFDAIDSVPFKDKGFSHWWVRTYLIEMPVS